MVVTKKKRSKKVALLLTAGLAALIVVILAGLELTDTTHLLHKETVTPAVTGSQSTKGEPATDSTSTSPNNTSQTSTDDKGQTNTTEPGDDKSNSGGAVIANLLAPTGDFVSAHHIKLSTPVTSVCNTSPGANCSITFTSGSTTRSLAVETTDRGGSAYWNNWNPSSLGLNVGNWQISATATSSTDSKTASDPTTLEITQ